MALQPVGTWSRAQLERASADRENKNALALSPLHRALAQHTFPPLMFCLSLTVAFAVPAADSQRNASQRRCLSLVAECASTLAPLCSGERIDLALSVAIAIAAAVLARIVSHSSVLAFSFAFAVATR